MSSSFLNYSVMLDLITVIIPAYNAESTIEECLNSILNQTYKELEIIVVDDGSTDSTYEKSLQIAKTDDRIKVIHQEHLGASAARNHGLELLNGKYFSFIDSDDAIDSQYFDTLRNLADTNLADISAVTYEILPAQKKPRNIRLHEPVLAFSSDDAIKDLLYQKHIDCSAWGKLYKSQQFSSIRFRSDFHVYEDLYYVYEVIKSAKKIVWSNCNLYFYYRNSYGWLTKFSTNISDTFLVMETLTDAVNEDFPSLRKAANNRSISASMNLLRLCSISKEQDDVLEDKCWQTITTLRRQNFFDPHVRIKNKIGIIVTLFGKDFAKKVFRIFSRNKVF